MSEKFDVLFFCNGEMPDLSLIASYPREAKEIIAVDGGLLHCNSLKITPSLLIGDFDSISKELAFKYQAVPHQKYPREKDKSDFELALESILSKNDKKALVFGALGKRLDHTLYNTYLLTRYPQRLYYLTPYEMVFAIEKQRDLATYAGQTLSLFPLLGPARNITTTGLKWEIQRQSLDSTFMSLSNVALGSHVRIEIEEGVVLCCMKLKEEYL